MPKSKTNGLDLDQSEALNILNRRKYFTNNFSLKNDYNISFIKIKVLIAVSLYERVLQ